MKYVLIIVVFFLFCNVLSAQQKDSVERRRIDCGTKAPLRPYLLSQELMRRVGIERVQAGDYMIKIFFHIISDNDGSNPACADSTIYRQLSNTIGFYNPHNICFLPVGIETINSTDLNEQNADTEQNELIPYLVDNCLNVFVHTVLKRNDAGLNGSSYTIPNNYLSISRSAIQSSTNLSTLAHEIGHCLNLLHTFEDAYGKENVARSGACKNCDSTGDLICDTNADPDSDSYNIESYINVDCLFTDDKRDSCNVVYNVDPHNIMAYGRRECRDLFTSQQGFRMRLTILTEDMLTNMLAPLSLTINQNATYVSGHKVSVAKDFLIVNASNYTISNSCRAYMIANSITLRPGVSLTPSSGVVVVRANARCQ